MVRTLSLVHLIWHSHLSFFVFVVIYYFLCGFSSRRLRCAKCEAHCIKLCRRSERVASARSSIAFPTTICARMRSRKSIWRISTSRTWHSSWTRSICSKSFNRPARSSNSSTSKILYQHILSHITIFIYNHSITCFVELVGCYCCGCDGFCFKVNMCHPRVCCTWWWSSAALIWTRFSSEKSQHTGACASRCVATTGWRCSRPWRLCTSSVGHKCTRFDVELYLETSTYCVN